MKHDDARMLPGIRAFHIPGFLMSLLGIDVGSSSCKGVVFDEEGRPLVSASKAYETTSPAPGRMEMDAGRFWDAVAGVIRELARQTPADPIAALSVSCHGETLVPLGPDGAACGPAMLNSDHRAGAQANRLSKALGTEAIHRITGSPPHAMFPLCKVLWLKENEPDAFDRVRRFVSVGAYILSRMGLEPLTDHSLASRMMAFDIRLRQWSDSLLKAAGISPDQLDLIRPAGEPAGALPANAARDLGLPKGTVVVMGGHDQPCGALGAGIVDPGEVSDSAGTFECLVAASQSPADARAAFVHSLNSYCHVVPHRYVTLAFFPGGIASQWFLDQFCGEDCVQAAKEGRSLHELLAERVKSAGADPTGIIFTPHLIGSFNPRWNANARGAIAGLGIGSTRHHLYKAVFEGLACELSLNIHALEEAVGPIGQIRIFGGNARSLFTVQLRADITGHDMVLLDTSEAVCRGAAMLAGIGIGLYRDAKDAVLRAVRTTQVIASDHRRTSLYSAQFGRYQSLYDSLHPANPRP